MAADDVASWERTEAPSPRKLREARLDGRIARSPDLATACLLLAAAAAVTLAGGAAVRSLGGFLASSLASPLPFTDPAGVEGAALEGLLAGASIVLPAAAGLAAIAYLGGLAQVGVVFTARPLAPRPARLSPAANLGGIASGRSLRRLATDLVKIAAVVVAVWWTIGSDAAAIVGLMALPAGEAAAGAAAMLLRIAFAVGAALLAVGIVDWLLERRRVAAELRMTRREAAEERRDEEGDPAARRRRVEFGRSLAASPAVAVRRATALVVGRAAGEVVHAFAVAIPDAGEPRLVATARGEAAVRLAALAAAAGVPRLEDSRLAQALADLGVRPGSTVPPEVRGELAESLARSPEAVARIASDGVPA
jgi:flagellar biosynthetic protein FlhB